MYIVAMYIYVVYLSSWTVDRRTILTLEFNDETPFSLERCMGWHWSGPDLMRMNDAVHRLSRQSSMCWLTCESNQWERIVTIQAIQGPEVSNSSGKKAFLPLLLTSGPLYKRVPILSIIWLRRILHAYTQPRCVNKTERVRIFPCRVNSQIDCPIKWRRWRRRCHYWNVTREVARKMVASHTRQEKQKCCRGTILIL
jgi:hypothetical protein